ncbi:FHA domain-containing protein [Anaerovirgula multivorans]|uniref:FHA domain-containing protein n=1 Tax=Anaerovirgula multivorans TaxID=312168 RepID=UPI0015955F3F|nr:FHA domain-containing protein [Anaerovirgula multivorans]
MEKSISGNIKVIDVLISLISIGAGIYVYIAFDDNLKKYAVSLALGIVAIIYISKALDVNDSSTKEEITNSPNAVNGLALLNEENEMIKEWDLLNQASMVIGRNTKDNEVDIDLSTSTYAALIDLQHAVLNFASGNWYIEDLYSENGISIQKAEDRIRYKLSKDKPCRIIKGDVVFIAKTKLLIR